MKVRFALKAATDDLHQELDSRLSRLDLAEEPDYRRFLRFHARTVPAIESALAAGGLSDVVDGWGDTRRSDDIAADLAELGETAPHAAPVPAIDGVSELLGTAYVLEGSRLGGKVLRRRVGEGLPARFLSGTGGDPGWTQVIAALDRCLYSDDRIGEASRAARRCFTLFLSVAEEDGI